MKTVPAFDLAKNNEIKDDEKKKEYCRTDFKPKETSSALPDSYKCQSNIKDRVRF